MTHKRRFLHVSWLVVLLGFVWVPVLQAANVNLGATSDAFVSSANPTNNYGGAGAITISAAGLPKGEMQSVMMFDLASAKTSFDTTYGAGQWTVTGIPLQLTAAAAGNALFNTSAAGNIAIGWMQNDSWVEGAGTPMAPGATGITFNTLPSFLSGADQALGTFAFGGATSGNFNFAFNLPSGIVGDVTAGSLASLRFSAADSTVSGVFNSRTFKTAAMRPALTITAVPEPATWLLAVISIGCLFIARRRHR